MEGNYMIKKLQYITIAERTAILSENSSMFLIEEQNITEGNFLILSDEQPLIQKITEDLSLVKAALDDLILGGGF
jgi:hypothetical protein